VLAEVRQLALEELGRRRRDEHLPAVPGGGDARRAMDVATDVALLGEERCAGVETDTHRDRA
jgi:hypothetical protein